MFADPEVVRRLGTMPGTPRYRSRLELATVLSVVVLGALLVSESDAVLTRHHGLSLLNGSIGHRLPVWCLALSASFFASPLVACFAHRAGFALLIVICDVVVVAFAQRLGGPAWLMPRWTIYPMRRAWTTAAMFTALSLQIVNSIGSGHSHTFLPRRLLPASIVAGLRNAVLVVGSAAWSAECLRSNGRPAVSKLPETWRVEGECQQLSISRRHL